MFCSPTRASSQTLLTMRPPKRKLHLDHSRIRRSDLQSQSENRSTTVMSSSSASSSSSDQGGHGGGSGGGSSGQATKSYFYTVTAFLPLTRLNRSDSSLLNRTSNPASSMSQDLPTLLYEHAQNSSKECHYQSYGTIASDKSPSSTMAIKSPVKRDGSSLPSYSEAENSRLESDSTFMPASTSMQTISTNASNSERECHRVHETEAASGRKSSEHEKMRDHNSCGVCSCAADCLHPGRHEVRNRSHLAIHCVTVRHMISDG